MLDNQLRAEFFQGHLSLEQGDGWIKPWRLPHRQEALFPSPRNALMQRASNTSGVRLRFATTSEKLTLRFLPLNDGSPAGNRDCFYFDATIDDELLVSVAAQPGAVEAEFHDLPLGDKVVELWLPQEIPVRLCSIVSNEGTSCDVMADDRHRWITYGSSLTHCTRAHSPARIWPAIVSRRHGLHLTNLGFGGQCHVDAQVAMVIAEQPADLITLKLGINCMPGGSFNARTFPAAVLSFVRIVRAAHPNIPIGLISPIGFPPHETKSNSVGYTIEDMRDAIADVHKRLVSIGDENLYYFDGLDVFSLQLIDRYAEDQCHPDADGIEIMAENFDCVVMKTLLASR